MTNLVVFQPHCLLDALSPPNPARHRPLDPSAFSALLGTYYGGIAGQPDLEPGELSDVVAALLLIRMEGR
jgi:hypothetical protein